jgi:RNA polymerase sigma-70 factor (ECF subfamily)
VGRVPAHDAEAQAALETLYRRYSASVYGLALRIVGDPGVAENLVQETFCRLWVHAAHYQPGRVRFATWLLRMARNLAISELRYAARRPRLISFGTTVLHGQDGEAFTLPAMDEQRDPAVDVPDEVWARERRRVIVAGLEGLPPLQRHALELAYYGGLSHAEIAAAQGAPMSTVKTRLALGLRKMADHLSACGVTM